jgi:hypothetical protein
MTRTDVVCPTCGKEFTDWMVVARHMRNSAAVDQSHLKDLLQILKEIGKTLRDLRGKGALKALADGLKQKFGRT